MHSPDSQLSNEGSKSFIQWTVRSNVTLLEKKFKRFFIDSPIDSYLVANKQDSIYDLPHLFGKNDEARAILISLSRYH